MFFLYVVEGNSHLLDTAGSSTWCEPHHNCPNESGMYCAHQWCPERYVFLVIQRIVPHPPVLSHRWQSHVFSPEYALLLYSKYSVKSKLLKKNVLTQRPTTHRDALFILAQQCGTDVPSILHSNCEYVECCRTGGLNTAILGERVILRPKLLRVLREWALRKPESNQYPQTNVRSTWSAQKINSIQPKILRALAVYPSTARPPSTPVAHLCLFFAKKWRWN